MGVYTNTTGQDIFIAKENFPMALAALKAIDWHTAKFDGYLPDPTQVQGAENLMDAIEAFDWIANRDDQGNINLVDILNDKNVPTDALWKTIAPWVQSGSFVNFENSEGALWRYNFINGGFESVDGEVTYEASSYYAIVRWHATDVLEMAGQCGREMTPEQAEAWLQAHESQIEEVLVERGWELIESLLLSTLKTV